MPACAQKPPPILRWENFTTANGMPDEKVLCVAVDGDHVWAGTENGLVLIKKGKIQKVYKTGRRPGESRGHRHRRGP